MEATKQWEGSTYINGQDSLTWPDPILCFHYIVQHSMQGCAIAEGEDRVWLCETNGKMDKAELEVEHEVIQCDSGDTLRDKKVA